MTEIRNQKRCQSCWAFAAITTVEARHFLDTGKLVELSEQQLVDCSGHYGNHGCNAGWTPQGYKYIRDVGGLALARVYPYRAVDGDCRYKRTESTATIEGYVTIPEGDEKELTIAVATVGPVAVAIDASHDSFQSYKSGIYYEPNCDAKNLDHAVVVIGYGVENGHEYYLVRNSWGKSWGEDGYVKMPRNKGNHCGIATEASHPVARK